MFRPELLLVHEPVAACEARLRTEGYDAVAAGEIASYLAQSTDLA
ncbi:MAG: D-alanine:D-lactate ligase-like protein, partial [Hyphomicrobiales bacterium]|nr:D-alanine:D-lactate ligase-like protein [Hyphomicrobiales bacterium]